MIDTNAIYLQIKKIADRQKNSSSVITRADLAFELKPLGILQDSVDVSRLVYEAYCHYNNDESIERAFVTNDRKSIVDSYELCSAAELMDIQTISYIAEGHCGRSADSLKVLEEKLKDVMGNSGNGRSSDIMSVITGAQGGKNIMAAVNTAYDKYQKLVGAYDWAVGDVKAVMSDFVFLREQVNAQFQKYSLALVDIFGNSVKTVAPEIFDYDAVEYLDVKGMMDAVRLEYDTLSSTCSALIDAVNNNFSKSVKDSVNLYKSAGGDRVTGLVLAALGMAGHYLDAAGQTAAVSQDFERFKDKIKKDAFTIKGDMGRLYVIYRTISELYIPKSEAFYRYADEVLTPEFDSLLESLYSTPELKFRKENRDNLLQKFHENQNRLIDDQLNIDIYSSSIAANRQIIDSSRDNYNLAKSLRPSKPFFLFNLLTFGGLNTKYNRELSEWYDKYSYAIKSYEEKLVDIKMDTEELNKLRKDYKNCQDLSQKLNVEINKLTEEMKRTLVVSGENKEKVLAHLEAILRLLKIAKDIVSSGLDERYIKAVEIGRYETLELSDETKGSIAEFADSVRKEISAAYEDNAVALEIEASDRGDNAEDMVDILSEEKLRMLDETEMKALDKAVVLFQEYAKLQELKRMSSVSDKLYLKRLNSLQEEFRKDMDSITARGDVLRGCFAKINTASSQSELKECSVVLSGSDSMLSEKDFERFLKGEINIEI